MNRREFLRSLVAASIFAGTGLAGLSELVTAARSNEKSQNLPTPITISETEQASVTTESTQTSETGVTTLSSTTTASSVMTSEPVSIINTSLSETTSALSTTEESQSVITSSSSTSESNVAPSAPDGYFLLTSLSYIVGRSYVYFRHPTYGNSILVNYNGSWNAFNATCTHAACTVDYENSLIYCPCHGGEFDPSDGSVVRAPPTRPLQEYGVIVQDDYVYVSND